MDEFDFSASATVCTNCDPPHPAVMLNFSDLPDGTCLHIGVDVKDARQIAEEMFRAVLEAEASC